MRGWHHHSYEHALASRGITTRDISENIVLKNNDFENLFPRGISLRRKIIKSMHANSEIISVDIVKNGTWEIIGNIRGYERPNIIHVSRLYIDEKYRGIDLSKILLREMVNVADEMRKDMDIRVSSFGDISNTNLIKYYETFDFKPIGNNRKLIRRYR